MKMLFYFVAAISALVGFLAILRTLELVVTGNGFKPAQVLIAIAGFAVAGLFVRKARGK